MRKVNYIVRKADGTEFTTTDYKQATTNGNKIFKTFLTEVKDEYPKTLEWNKKHAKKIAENPSNKRSL